MSAAILTDAFKKQLLEDVLADFVDSANHYFAGIGRSEDWNDSDVPLIPQNSARDVRNTRLAIQSVKNITDMSFCIPRHNWTTGAIYSAFDDNVIGYPSNSYYVMNSNQQVYLCLRQGSGNINNASTDQPSGNTTGQPFKTPDGYVWKFVYSIGALRATKFLSSAYMPVQLVVSTDSDSPAEIIEQKAIQDAAIPGQIVGYAMIDQGLNYTVAPQVKVNGNGANAKAVAVVIGNQVVRVDVKEDSSGNIAGDYANNSYYGHDYEYASVEFIGGTGSGAKARPIFAPKAGFGADPRDDFKSSAVMFNTKPDGKENGAFIVGQDFRQVTLLKNLLQTDSAVPGGLFTESVGRTLNKLAIGSINSGPFTRDVLIEGQTSMARAYIDDFDSANIWYHQSEETGYKAFQASETIEIVNGGATTAIINSILKGKVDPLTGELLYIDNRAAVIRSTDQAEDIKIVIQL